MTIQSIRANWKTSYAGIGMIVGGITHLVVAIYHQTLTQTMFITEVMACVTGYGFLEAGDASKSDKDMKAVDTKIDQTVAAVATGNTDILPKPTPPATELPKP
jgi:sulfite exporter TauE/SafE